jgi:hypothetical protein
MQTPPEKGTDVKKPPEGGVFSSRRITWQRWRLEQLVQQQKRQQQVPKRLVLARRQALGRPQERQALGLLLSCRKQTGQQQR